jgi:hydroxymethylpyrimidine/phosphomethylpyrimidine kinase
MARSTPVALSIAGSDSGGGAGIQADLKAFARLGVHGTCAITAITAQNTVGVEAIEPVAPEIVLAQVRAILHDIGVDAVKVGMLGTAPVTRAVAQALDELPDGTPVVVDPVMVAESGAWLLDDEALRALVAEILPRADVLTPNLPEARLLAGLCAPAREPAAPRVRGLSATGGEIDRPARRDDDAKTETKTKTPTRARESGPRRTESGGRSDSGGEQAETEGEEAETLARVLLAGGSRAVVLTGGHRAEAIDLFVGSDLEVVEIQGERHPDGAAHGSGCTHSSVLAAELALGRSPLQAARTARTIAGEAVAHGLRGLGAGAGPVDAIGLAAMRSR